MAEPISVCLTVEFDAMCLWTGSLNVSNLSDLSRGEFDRVAVPRVLRMLEERGIVCTWLVPGAVARTFPDLVEEVVARGHELAHHGWAHEAPGDPPGAAERANLERGLEALERAAGRRPVGYRVPGGFLTNGMIALLREYGFEWDSSLEATDFEAYFVREGDALADDGSYLFGEETEIVELPVSWGLDDFPAMEFVWGFNAGLRAPSAVLEMWTADFDFACERVPGGVFSFCVHSQVIGRGHRLAVFERLLDHIASTPGVRFETMGAYAQRWREARR